jgi:hypothetical protein
LEHGKNKKFPVDDWNIQTATNLVDLNNYKCFWFEKIESEIIEGPGKYTVNCKIVQRSGHYFINGFVETIEDVNIRDKDLAEKMEEKGWSKVVSGINNNWCYGFEEGKDNIVEI